MDLREKDAKVNRILTMYLKLTRGEGINKKELADKFMVNEKTIQRDLSDIKSYFYDNREILGEVDIKYDRGRKCYYIEKLGDILTKEDVLAVIKILLESRAFCKQELKHITESMLKQIDFEQRKSVKDIIGNEMFNYIPLQHDDLLLKKIWTLSELIRCKEIINIDYKKMNNDYVQRVIKPTAIIFSEYYFYLIAYMNDYTFPTIFRIDRIESFSLVGEKFHVSNIERFEDGEFRKRVQFMYAGKLQKIRFEFWGSSIEAVLDRIPTANIISNKEGRYLVEAEIYGKGIIMWILSQGEYIRLISPQNLVDEIREKISKMLNNY